MGQLLTQELEAFIPGARVSTAELYLHDNQSNSLKQESATHQSNNLQKICDVQNKAML